jgi:hypothetical protein
LRRRHRSVIDAGDFASAVGSALFSETASNRVFLRSIQDEIDSTVLLSLTACGVGMWFDPQQ